ncbi:MAG TPA: hypothetical protein P5531_02915 [Bacteroidales bacterium]|nr:hypothetical protein [Bacteroidales bacterium]HSA42529.1 hypothetical protein [Bacteroidales bacterium]
MKYRSILGFLAATLLLFSCLKEKEDPVLEMNDCYFPLETGQWWQYTVDSIIVAGFFEDSVRWEIREQVDSVSVDSENNRLYWLRQYKRKAGQQAWDPVPFLFTVTRSPQQAVRTENNLSVVKMVFPLFKGVRWDGNALNTMAAQEFSCQAEGEPLGVGDFLFVETAHILQQDLSTLISRDFAEEVFADGTGLVYAYRVHLENLHTMQFRIGSKVRTMISGWWNMNG